MSKFLVFCEPDVLSIRNVSSRDRGVTREGISLMININFTLKQFRNISQLYALFNLSSWSASQKSIIQYRYHNHYFAASQAVILQVETTLSHSYCTINFGRDREATVPHKRLKSKNNIGDVILVPIPVINIPLLNLLVWSMSTDNSYCVGGTAISL